MCGDPKRHRSTGKQNPPSPQHHTRMHLLDNLPPFSQKNDFFTITHRLRQGESVSTCELWHLALIQLVPPRPTKARATLCCVSQLSQCDSDSVTLSHTRSSFNLSPEQSTATPRSEGGELLAKHSRLLHPKLRPRSPGFGTFVVFLFGQKNI